MATKSAQPEPEKLDVEEALDLLDKTMDRVKSLYEQYFLGIQKQPPTFIHTDLERKLRDLAAVQIRNTGLRYRFVTLQQKFGSYNSYWRRTLRQIENGTYGRSLSKLGRKAAMTGEEIPEEILAKMPKRMRDQVKRDREAALALAKRRDQLPDQPADDGEFYDDYIKPAAPRVDARGAHVLSDGDGDIDLDAYFASVNDERDEGTDVSARLPEPEFDDLATPPVPAAPAPLRAASLGGPRTGPHVVQRPPFLRANTEPGLGPHPVQPTAPRREASMTAPDQLVVGAKPLGRPGAPMDPSQSGRLFAPSQGVRPNPIAPGSSIAKPVVGVETMQGPFAREPSVVVPPRRSKRDTDIDQPAEPDPTEAPPMRPTPRPFAPTPAPMRVPSIPMIPRPAGATPTPTPIRPVGATPTPTPNQPIRPPGATPSQPNRQTGATPTPPPIRPVAATPTPTQPVRPTPAQPTPPPRQPTGAQPTPPRPVAPPQSRPAMRPASRPPPGMTDDDVSALYQKYVKAKEMVGEATNAQTYGKLLNTINAQAPKIMEQYKAKGVDFSVVVKDNQVIIRAKPKP